MKLTPTQIKRLQIKGANVSRTPKTGTQQPGTSPQEQEAIAKVSDEARLALNAAASSAEKITEALELSREQTEKLMLILIEIERERNRPKRAIIKRESKGDRLIESVDFVSID